ncbi:MAG: LysR substrate-binding domain-containing protein [Pseudomonadota bacterium]
MGTHINLRMLGYLVALADTRHFGRAAEQCFVSQPTLSAQLRKLETQLGVTLIERQPRNVMLTPVGRIIVERARGMLREAEEIESLARSYQNPLSGTLKIALIPTLGPYLLPHIVRRIRRELPELACQYLEYQTDPLLRRLHEGKLDVGLLALPIDADGLVVLPLFEEPFRLAVPAEHPLAGRRRVRMDKLRGERFLLLEDGHCLRDQALEICATSGIDEQDGFRATSLETLRQMVAAGAGMTLLPALTVESPGLGGGDLAAIPFTKPVPKREIAAVYRPTTTRTEAIQAIAGVIDATVPRLAA